MNSEKEQCEKEARGAAKALHYYLESGRGRAAIDLLRLSQHEIALVENGSLLYALTGSGLKCFGKPQEIEPSGVSVREVVSAAEHPESNRRPEELLPWLLTQIENLSSARLEKVKEL